MTGEKFWECEQMVLRDLEPLIQIPVAINDCEGCDMYNYTPLIIPSGERNLEFADDGSLYSLGAVIKLLHLGSWLGVERKIEENLDSFPRMWFVGDRFEQQYPRTSYCGWCQD